MTTHPITCHLNETLNVAAQRMWDADIGAVLVVDDGGQLIGVITDRDVCMAAYTRGGPLTGSLVASAMAKDVAWVHPEDTVADVAHLMSKHQVHRIPVIDDGGRPIGIISIGDLATASARPETHLKHVAHTLAGICTSRGLSRNAA